MCVCVCVCVCVCERENLSSPSEFTAPDTSRFFCKVYFAEEFQHLRELIFPSGEDK